MLKNDTDLQAVLDRGKALLDKGDVAGYRNLMSRYSGFARLAGDVASGKGLMAHLATRDLQRATLKSRGTKFSREKLAQIRFEIADADLRSRQDNLENKGHIGVTGKDTVDYHNEVFEKWKLPENTYTPAHMQNLIGAYWSKVLGAPTRDARSMDLFDAYEEMKKRFEENPEQFIKSLDALAGEAFRAVNDLGDFIGDDKTLTQPTGVGHDPLEGTVGPRQQKEREQEKDGKGTNDTSDTSPEARKFLDDVVKPGSQADEILLKPVSKWTDDELGVVMGARLNLPSGHPERNRMADKETEFFKRFHGAGTTPPIPKVPAPARAPDGSDLASALRRVGADVVRAAGRGGLPPSLSDLQRGINFKRDAATALKVDGAFGPLTRTALRSATADLGPAGVERMFALGRFHGFAEDARRDGPAGASRTRWRSPSPVRDAPRQGPSGRSSAHSTTWARCTSAATPGGPWTTARGGSAPKPRPPSPRSCGPPAPGCSPSASADSSESCKGKRDVRGRAEGEFPGPPPFLMALRP